MFFNEEPVYETQHVVMPGHLKTISAFPEPPQATNFQVFMLDTNKDPIEWQNVQLEDRVAF
ncbi:F-box protein, partial [Trifolium medium]|nr:F-box protein [Trifolium medium]